MTQKYKISMLLIVNISFLWFSSCRCHKAASSVAIEGKPAMITFLDSTEAALAIISDDVDGFFSQITALDMSIQMKKNYTDRPTALKAYQKYLRTEVMDFTTDEKLFMVRLFEEAKKMCDTLSPRIFPGGMRLVKIRPNHYGRDVYYTRGNDIMIPANIFETMDADSQLPIMLHEIFHIISRYQPEVRKEMYSLIGFTKAKTTPIASSPLAERLLTNPDGVTMDYVQNLGNEVQETVVIPLIKSKFKEFSKDRTSFFEYLDFDLYEVKDNNGKLNILADGNAATTVELKKTPNFFTQIKDNTQYIIHPDEIMADNFMLALLAYKKNEYNKFSKEGRQLIDDVLTILKSR